MIDQTKKGYKASEIKKVALPLLLAMTSNDTNDYNVPAEIVDLPLFAMDRSVVTYEGVGGTNGKIQGIIFFTGSGFGHWGIAVCPFPDGEKSVRTLKGEITPWEDGVYFFLEN